MFLKKWCLLLSKRLGIILLFLIITTVFCGCTYAGGVPKYNPKDPNPKPGLYRVGDMNYRRDVLSVVPLNNKKILFFGIIRLFDTSANYKTSEIFNLDTGKFTIGEPSNYYLKSYVKLDDGRIVILGGKNRSNLSEQCLEIYDPKTNKFIDTKICIGDGKTYTKDAKIYKLNNNTIALYNTKDKYHNEYVMYRYDVNSNTLSEKILEKGDNGYVDKDKLTQPSKLNNLDASREKALSEKIGRFSYLNLQNGKGLIIARDYVDYGVPVDSIIKVQSIFDQSWYSPIYEYDFKDETLTPINQFAPFTSFRHIKIKDKNLILIYRTTISSRKQKYANQPPKRVPYKDRIFVDDTTVFSKHAYIYIY